MTYSAPNLTLITAEAALEKIKAQEQLRYLHVQGKLELSQLTTENYAYFPYALTIAHCYIEDISGAGGFCFQQPVVLRDTHFGSASFIFAYFLRGLHIEECVFNSYLDFQAGGHNEPGYPVKLLRNMFRGFVNFFDCWYEGPVVIENNSFEQGTNLLGNPGNIPVTFDEPLQQTGN